VEWLFVSGVFTQVVEFQWSWTVAKATASPVQASAPFCLNVNRARGRRTTLKNQWLSNTQLYGMNRSSHKDGLQFSLLPWHPNCSHMVGLRILEKRMSVFDKWIQAEFLLLASDFTYLVESAVHGIQK
jgi:hypothetical protein